MTPVKTLLPKVRAELWGWADSPAKRLLEQLCDSVEAELTDHDDVREINVRLQEENRVLRARQLTGGVR